MPYIFTLTQLSHFLYNTSNLSNINLKSTSKTLQILSEASAVYTFNLNIYDSFILQITGSGNSRTIGQV